MIVCRFCADDNDRPATVEVSSTDYPEIQVCDQHIGTAWRLAHQTAIEAGDTHPRVNVDAIEQEADVASAGAA